MKEQLINIGILSSMFLLVFLIGEIAYRVFHVRAEYTRKWSHIASGFLSLLFPYFLSSVLWVGVICGLFVVVLNFSKPFGLLPSINAVERKTYGSILFPIAVFVSYLAYSYFDRNEIYYFLPIMTLAISDLLAAIVGKKYPILLIPTFGEKKSIGGYIAFSVSAIFIYLTFIWLGFPIGVLSLFLLPPLVALVELYSPRGLDNISIPLAVIFGLMILNG